VADLAELPAVVVVLVGAPAPGPAAAAAASVDPHSVADPAEQPAVGLRLSALLLGHLLRRRTRRRIGSFRSRRRALHSRRRTRNARGLRTRLPRRWCLRGRRHVGRRARSRRRHCRGFRLLRRRSLSLRLLATARTLRHRGRLGSPCPQHVPAFRSALRPEASALCLVVLEWAARHAPQVDPAVPSLQVFPSAVPAFRRP
jgi:hypothetical protein